jgi:F0F1-type ATP synthase membrane subunit b/b'
MDMVLGIFKQLGADETLWVQFGIAVGMLLISKFLFLTHLQTIIEQREERTVGLEGDADKQLDEVNKLSESYKMKINSATKEIRAKVENEKASITKDLETKYKTEEKTVNDYVDESRKVAEVKVSEQKGIVLAQAEELSLSLVQRITKG